MTNRALNAEGEHLAPNARNPTRRRPACARARSGRLRQRHALDRRRCQHDQRKRGRCGAQSFNDSAARGLDKAKSERGIEVKELEATAGETDAQKEDRLRQLAEGGYNPIIAVGFAYAKAVGAVAKDE